MRRRGSLCGLRIRLTDPALVPNLLEFLRGSVSCVARQVGDHEIEVSLLGSYDAELHGHRVDLLVRAWEATDPHGAGQAEQSR